MSYIQKPNMNFVQRITQNLVLEMLLLSSRYISSIKSEKLKCPLMQQQGEYKRQLPLHIQVIQ